MPELPKPSDTSIATAPSTEAELGSTTDTGAPAPSDRNSLTIGPDGPILLHDVHFLEQMAHFNREKVPERQPHAKGAGAFGVFETSADVSRYTKAAIFRKGCATEMLARFSTVAAPDPRSHPARGVGRPGYLRHRPGTREGTVPRAPRSTP